MEFKYHDGQNQRTPSPMPHPFSTTAYISRNTLQGSEFAPSSFPNNVSVPRVFPMSMPINVEEEVFLQEMEKKQIQREILASEMALARRQELEDEVRREIAMEKALGIPMQRPEGISFQRVSRPLNNQSVNHVTL